jgi:uncharacterized protein YdhG (YjbR/CyaY superfamily)
MNTSIKTVNEYIATYPEEVQSILTNIRSLIKDLAPDAVEKIAYGMPAFKTEGKPLIYFAAFSKHIGLYATPTANVRFAEKLQNYTYGKGSIQFPLNKPIPYDLVREIVVFKYTENQLMVKKTVEK